MSRWILLAAFLLVLASPLAMSWWRGRAVQAGGSEGLELVVITPHQEAIRREFAEAFSRYHEKEYGQKVNMTYLTFGASDIVKLFDEKAKTAKGHYQIDVAWGGGDVLFDLLLKRPGYLAPLKLDEAYLRQVYPQKMLRGLPLYDLDEKDGPAWFGTALASFGIVYNRDVLRQLGLEEPKTWRDMADPRLAGWVVLVDPTKSASAKQAYMVIIERAMADAKERGESEDSGWADGMGLIRQIFANARMITDGSSMSPILVSQGEAAVGMSIDSLARGQIEAVGGRLGYIEPVNATIVNPDPIGMVAGAPNPELAKRFIQFVLSQQGQKLWNIRAGASGGPVSSSLHRLPVRRDAYDDMSDFTDKVNPFAMVGAFNKVNERERTFSVVGDLLQASCIDLLDELRATRARIRLSPDAGSLDAKLGRFPFDQQEALRRQAKLRDKSMSVSEKLAMVRAWTEQFRQEYVALRVAAQHR